ncbi:MAG: DUF2339 domain-containing protein [Planctomycetes bacterium]|nr:DUF2339 domain-containing protein [Planctomycetota bacterium]
MHRNLESRLEAIERRLEAIEQSLGQSLPPATTPGERTPAEPPAPLPAFLVADPAPWHTEPSPAASTLGETEPVAESAPEPEADVRRRARIAAQQRLREQAEREWQERLEKANNTPAIDWAKLESLVAGRWYALAGGLVVTIGVALFVQYAVKQGWLGQIPGWARCAMGGLFGIALLGTGEWARRKVNDWASVGLTAAGLGSLYISSYAAYALYELLSPGATLLVLAGVAGIGLAISAITSLSVVGLVSLIGAYIAPFIASSGNAGYVYLPLYWLALLVVGQLLAITKGGTFSTCRWFAAAATLLLGAGWITQFADDAPRIGLLMLGGAWLLFHAESSWTASRTDRTGALEYSELDLPSLVESEDFFKKATSIRIRPVVSISTSAWAASLGVYAARQSHNLVPESLAPGVVGTLAFVLACLLVGPARILNPRPSTKRERLAAALCASAGTLLVATVAIALSGFAQTIALTAIGLAALGAARWLRTQVLDIYSGLVLLFAAGRVLFYDSWATAPNAPGFEILGFYLTEWAGACAGVGIAWIVYAIAIRRNPPLPSVEPDGRGSNFIPAAWLEVATNFGLGLGIFVLGSSLMHERAAHESTACAMLATTLAYCFVGASRRSIGLRITSIVLLGVATACTLALTWWVRRSNTIEFAGLVLVPSMLVGIANSAVAIVLAWMFGRVSSPWARVSKILAGAGVFLLVLGISHADSSPTSLCYAWLAICWGCLALSRVAKGLAFEAHALLVWLVVLGTWTAKFGADNWTGYKAPPLLHPGLWIAFALAGTILGIRKLSKPVLSGQEAKSKALGWWAATTIVWASTSLEVARLSQMLPIDVSARGAAVSLWWGLFAILLLVVGFWRNEPLVRRCGLGLLAIATGKALVLDLARVAPGWRALSVVSLGLLMVCVGVVYARIAKHLSGAPPEPADSGAAPPPPPDAATPPLAPNP